MQRRTQIDMQSKKKNAWKVFPACELSVPGMELFPVSWKKISNYYNNKTVLEIKSLIKMF